MALNNMYIRTYVQNIIKNFSAKSIFNEYKFDTINVDYLTDELFSFSFETIPDEKIIKKYIDGTNLEQYKFLLVSNMLYTKDDLIMLDNACIFEIFSDWINNLNLENPENANFIPIQFKALGHAFINDNDNEKARYVQEVKFIYRTKNI